MTWTYSPRFHVRRRGIPEKDIEQYIPRLNTVSDVVWETWKANAPKPATLRFYAVDGIINDVAAPLMDYLFKRDAEPDEMGWKGRLTYGLDSDEGKALFGTPSGLAVAWLLIRNHGILGRRDLRVSIFRDEEEDEDKEKRCMIWELIPEGGKSTFDEYESRIGPIRR